MQRIQLAEDLQFSRVIHGLWRLNEWNYSDAELLSLIEWCIDHGITTFDHADIYGGYTCEKLFGNALALSPGLRENIELVTKCGIVLESPERPAHRSHHYNTSKSHILASVEQSLMNLRTDYIDMLLIHRPDPLMDPEGVAEAFQALKCSGKVRYFGVSNFKDHQYRMLESYLPEKLVTNQIELSAYELENMLDGTLNLCQEKRIPPMAWSPLACGKVFTGDTEKDRRVRTALESVQAEIGAASLDEVMYAWLYTHPADIMPIVGSGKRERISAAINALSYKLDQDQWFRIFTAVQGYDIP
ncbi:MULTISPECIES: aldo/keto reductase [Bacillus]|uniref:aldo/keto reductase n=1 Tax=Bacillus TaxID=1386 RepID=UPI0013630833|nr:aldo/keto reductase family oxidoreductase [Bacillus subtilis]MBO3637474.1 aldo/keto reductase family oxidoreductase [Bacillus subtilis]QHJ99530.1 Oxidoreductase YdhF [Bacillus subtilis]WIY65431.1 aldo/keto reductase family oxidoreductase [Bacillus subtilis]